MARLFRNDRGTPWIVRQKDNVTDLQVQEAQDAQKSTQVQQEQELQVQEEQPAPAVPIEEKATWSTWARVPQSDYLPMLQPIRKASGAQAPGDPPAVAFRAVAMQSRPLGQMFAWALSHWAALQSDEPPEAIEPVILQMLLDKFPTPHDLARAIGSNLGDYPDAKAWQFARFMANSDSAMKVLNLF